MWPTRFRVRICQRDEQVEEECYAVVVPPEKSSLPPVDEQEQKQNQPPSPSPVDGSLLLFHPSPDINTKADKLISRFRAGLKLENINLVITIDSLSWRRGSEVRFWKILGWFEAGRKKREGATF